MIQRNYYYLIAGLPDLSIETGKLQFSVNEFKEYLKGNLHKNDYALIEFLLLHSDNLNLINLLQNNNKPFIENGIYSFEYLTYCLNEYILGLKPYMQTFVKLYKGEIGLPDNVSPETLITDFYYKAAENINNKFIRGWFVFNLNLTNSLLALSGRKFKINYEQSIIGNSFISKSIRTSTLRDFGISDEWQYIEKVIQISEYDNPLQREKTIDLLKWSYLDSSIEFKYFTIDVLITYFIKLQMVERWLNLDSKIGEELFRKLLFTIKSSYEFPKEFSR